MVKKVAFRCDAGTAEEVGTGHIARSVMLAKALVDKEFLDSNEILFLTRDDPEFELGEKYLKSSGFEFTALSDYQLAANTEAEIQYLVNLSVPLILMDRLATSRELVVALQSSGKKVVTFDDYGQGRTFADLAISAIFDDVEESPDLYTGYKYLLLSSQSGITSNANLPSSRLVATFGGHDARDLCSFFLRTLKQLKSPLNIDVVLGRVDDHSLESYHRQAAALADVHGVSFYVYPKNYVEIISNARIAISSGGLSIFEFARAGVPTIGIPQYRHQLRTIEKLVSDGLVLCGSSGFELKEEQLASSLELLLSDLVLWEKMSEAAVAKIDGQGAGRVLGLFKRYFREIFDG